MLLCPHHLALFIFYDRMVSLLSQVFLLLFKAINYFCQLVNLLLVFKVFRIRLDLIPCLLSGRGNPHKEVSLKIIFSTLELDLSCVLCRLLDRLQHWRLIILLNTHMAMELRAHIVLLPL